MSKLDLSSQLRVGSVVDRYVIDRMLGQGGMGVVYRVRHQTLHSYSALKVVTSASRQLRERLLDEGRAQSRLRHPNVVQVTDVLDLNGQPGIVMEYVSGPGDLGQVLARKRLTIKQIDALARGILDGVEAAHTFGLVHRDLKPDNILLAQTSTGIVPKVADFGLVMDENADMRRTRSGVMLGTPAFMAPEQLRNAKRVDQRADIWALGAILYEMLSGQRPFPGNDMVELFSSIAAARRVPLEQVAPDTPPSMLAAVRGALVADPEQRIPDVPTLRAIWTGVERSVHPNNIWEGMLAGTTSSSDDERPTPQGQIETHPAKRVTAPSPPVVPPSPESDTPTMPLPEPATTSQPARRRGTVAVIATGAVLLLGVGGLWAAWVTVQETLDTATPDPITLSEPTPDPVQAPKSLSEPSPKAAPPAPAPAPDPAPPIVAPPDTAPATEPPPPAEEAVRVGRVRLENPSAGTRLTVSNASGRFSPGELPIGRYQGRAVFSDGTDIPIGEIQIREGVTTTIRCVGPPANLCKVLP